MLDLGQRLGLKPIRTMIQRDDMDDDLRVGLWNCLEVVLWTDDRTFWGVTQGDSEAVQIFKLLWRNYYKRPLDEVPSDRTRALNIVRKTYFESKWYDAYGLIEYILGLRLTHRDRLVKEVHWVLEQYKSGFRYIDGQFAPITDPEEIKEIESAVSKTSFKGASQHLRRALELYSDIKQPDYRNSIKESISAVESVAQELTGKNTLGNALKELESKYALHPALKEGFLKLYGYTSDADGVRHAIMDDSVAISESDARYMLVTCSAFVNYLKSTYR